MQYELKKCQDQTGMKNDKLDDKTRWESKTEKYMFTDKQINKAIKKCPLKNIKIYEEDILYERNKYRRETGQDTTESTSDTTVSETDTTGHES